ncbi:MAG: AMP-binding protein [Actinomycetota bacterium]
MTDEERTFPKLLAGMAEGFGDDRVALQEKRYGIWQSITWGEYHARVRRFAQGLLGLGLERGHVLAILGDNRPEWLIAELAAQSVGGMSLGLYADGVAEEIGAILEHAGARIVVAEDQEQVDKLVELRRAGRLPFLEKVIYYDPHGLERYDLDILIEFTEVERSGGEIERDRPGWFEERVESGKASDVAILCTTSGTTGRPKLAMLSHANLLEMGRSLMAVDPIEADDEFLSFLPLAWIGEQMIAVACGLQAGFALSFPEDPTTTVRSDLREIGPRVMFSPPRIWQSLVSSVQVRLGDADPLKRAVFSRCYAIGERAAEYRLRGQQPPLLLRMLHRVAERISLWPVRDQLGLSRLRRAYTGGAPLGPDVFGFFHAIGVNLKQIYGQTEICGIAVLHRDGDIRFNTVGEPLPGTDLRITEDGEILLRSSAVFQGYYRNEDATREALTDGWLHTGDAGYLDEGHLVVIDRASDVMRTADGAAFSPAFVENKLKFSPYVEEAVVLGGEDRPYVAAMISIDMDTVATWAERRRLSFTTYIDLAQKPDVYKLITEEIARANEDLPENVRVRRFLLLHKQLDADDDELTRTRKVRRGLVNDRYADIFSALYSEAGSVTVRAVITYQDGTKIDQDVTLRIASLNGRADAATKSRRPAWSVG